jgi:CubicO group peptidase (beta-lactamase class C family)
MKTNYRFIYVTTFLLALFLAGCTDENDVSPDGDVTDDVIDNGGTGDTTTTHQLYFPPVGSNDWEKTTATEAGWDTVYLNEAIRYVRDNASYNLLIIHKGKMMVEEYWRASEATTVHEVHSIAKSMMSYVIGNLQAEGKITLDDKVSDYLPQGWSASPETESQVSIKHLLTMTSGLKDGLLYVGRPGQTWRYSDDAYKVLYDVVEAATGSTYRDLFNSLLFSKIGITNFEWTGRELGTSARDIAKLGLLTLNHGVWDGQDIMHDEGYFERMLSTSQSIQYAYGYLWWLNGKESHYDGNTKVTTEGSLIPTMPDAAWIAKGQHDQRVYIVPNLDLIVVRQGGSTGLPEVGEGSFDVEFWKRLMKAVNNGELLTSK